MKELIADVVRAHNALGAAGQADMVWGHVSIRDPDGRGVWMKAAGWGFEEIGPDRVLLVSWDGEVLDGVGKRHIEYPIHTGIMRARSDVDCVIHTHAPAANAFASLEVPLRAISHDGVLFTEPDIPRFTRTGSLIRTVQLGDALARSLGEARGCLMPQHGLAVAGPDAAHAVMFAVLLERACRIQLTAMAAGGPQRWSDAEEVALKVAECWPPSQINAGWQYLVRKAGQSLT
jgi:ribulose-5-phosphate 4-epimerase/fuculose-1-phosphate aldolase